MPVGRRIGTGLALALDDQSISATSGDGVIAPLRRPQALLDRPSAPFELDTHGAGRVVLLEHILNRKRTPGTEG